MFYLNLEEEIPKEKLNADYFYSIYQINSYIIRKVSLEIKRIEKLIKNKDCLIEKISNQAILLLKDEYLSYVLVHEYEIAKIGFLEEVVNENKFGTYIELTNKPEWLDYFFDKYPVLKERVEGFINNFFVNFNSLIFNIENDFSKLKNCFCLPEFIKIIDFELFLGDFHQNNKFVAKIEFENSKNIFFKPRNFTNEIFFNDLIQFFNLNEADIRCIIPKSLDCIQYSWTEEIIGQNNFTSETELAEFWCNQGKLLFLFYLLRTTDIIPDNLLIADNKPGYFDLECITSIPKYKNQNTIRSYFEESIINTGMLPVWMINNNYERNILSSTFFKFNSQIVEKKIWKQKGNSHEFKYTTDVEKFSNFDDKHLPKYNKYITELSPLYLKDVEKGFKFLYELTLKKEKTIKTFICDKANNISNKQRIILHPTSVYSLLIREINIPEELQGKTSIDNIILSIIRYSETDNNKIDSFKLLDSIKKQLYRLDIPYFYFDIEKGCLVDGLGNILNKDWEFNPKEEILKKIDSLSKIDLSNQLSILNKTVEFIFQIRGMDSKRLSFKNIFLSEKKFSLDTNLKNRLLNTAIAIGDKLLNNAIKIDDTINWVSKVRDPNDGRYQVSLLNYDLYDGLSGIVMFYSYLYKYTNNISYKKVALKIYDLLNELIIDRNETNFYDNIGDSVKETNPISPYAYPVSQIYLSTHIKSVFGPSYINHKEIDVILDIIIKLLPKNKNCDVLVGVSGLISLLIDLKKEDMYKMHISKINNALDISINIIKNNASQSNGLISWGYKDEGILKHLGGFAHGTAGIATILFKLYDFIKDENILNLAYGALSHDRNFFEPKIRGWKDTRDEAIVDSASWCHGSAGIGLSRLLIKKHTHENSIKKELDIARDNIVKNGFHGNQSICHGDLGNLEILKAINLATDYKNDNIYQYLNELINHYKDGKKFIYGDGGEMELLGLFVGSSGFGYQMLRFYNWEETPSILCLETPQNLNNELH